MRRQPTYRPTKSYQLPAHLERYASQVPAGVRRELTDAELLARCTEADRLLMQADRLVLSPLAYQAWHDRARAILTAAPLTTVTAERDSLLSKAAAATDPVVRAGFYDRAQQLEQSNPQVDSEALVKAHKIVNFSTRLVNKDSPTEGAVTEWWG